MLFGAIFGRSEREEIERRRAACRAPSTWRLRPDSDALRPSSWECVSQAQMAVEVARAREAAALAEARRDRDRQEAPLPPTGTRPSEPTTPVQGGTETEVTLTVSVEVETQNPQGAPWDVGGEAPDVALCVVSVSGTRCYPEGGTHGNPTSPQCQDASMCAFQGVRVPPSGFVLRVIDVDLLSNDTIGEGRCGIGSRCRIGLSMVQVGDETAFRSLTPAQHLAAGVASMREGPERDLLEARRHLQVIPTEAPEHAEAERLLSQSAREARRQAALVAQQERAARAAEARRRAVRAENARITRETGGTEGRVARQQAMRSASRASGLRVRATGPNGTTMLIESLGCTRNSIDRLLAGGNREEIRNAGFRRVECRGGAGVVSEDL